MTEGFFAVLPKIFRFFIFFENVIYKCKKIGIITTIFFSYFVLHVCRTNHGQSVPKLPKFLNTVLHCSVTVVTEKGTDMKEVFQEYGGVIITIVAIMSLIAITSLVIGDEQGGVIKDAFTNIITVFLQKAGAGIQ